jgi:putative membrane protein
MRNIWDIFTMDLKRLFANVVNTIVTLGLILLPSLFALYNIIACWDVFDNTGNVKVAVANTDEGFQSDLVPLRVNLGEQVISQLRANDQIKWEFVSEDEAIDGARAGRYYAAVVIPKTFSRDMLTFYDSDVDHAQITYYSNEKKNVIAPKVTDQSASAVSYQVNEAFAKALSEMSLSIVKMMSDYLDQSGADVRIVALATHMDSVGAQLDDAACALELFGSFSSAAQRSLDASYALISTTQDSLSDLSDAGKGAYEGASQAAQTLGSAADSFKDALDASAESYEKLANAAKGSASAIESSSEQLAQSMRDQAKALDDQIAAYQTLADLLRSLEGEVPSEQQGAIEAMAKRLDAAVVLAQNIQKQLNEGAQALDEARTQAAADREELEKTSLEAKAELEALSQQYDEEVRPALEQLEQATSAAVSAFDEGLNKVTSADLSGLTDQGPGSVREQMSEAFSQTSATAEDLHKAADKLRETANRLREAAQVGDTATLKEILSADPETLASALASPVGIDREAIFPSQSFGASMSPLYTTLAIFIGSLLIMVVVKPRISRKEQDQLKDPKPRQMFTGRFGVCAILSLAQTTIMALGNLLFLQIAVAHPFLFLLSYWFAGLVFTFIIYTLVVSFANLGKAIAVLMLIVQVTGCGGSYPLQILPWFVQAVSPWLPATHVVDAMRAAMLGIYQNDYWIAMGELALFLIPAALLGYALRKPLERFMHWYVEKVESTNLIS